MVYFVKISRYNYFGSEYEQVSRSRMHTPTPAAYESIVLIVHPSKLLHYTLLASSTDE